MTTHLPPPKLAPASRLTGHAASNSANPSANHSPGHPPNHPANPSANPSTDAPATGPQPISRQSRRPRAALALFAGTGTELTLVRGRVHEFCGPARRMLALAAARATEGQILWIAPAWQSERLHAEGILPLIQPGRLLFATPERAEDLLWCFEEGLRSGAIALVVGDLPEPPGLTPVRRLQLAAEAGGAAGRILPTGLILTPGDGGAQGAESRWHLAPRPGAATEGTEGTPAWRLERRRARTEPPAAWSLAADPGTGPGNGSDTDSDIGADAARPGLWDFRLSHPAAPGMAPELPPP